MRRFALLALIVPALAACGGSEGAGVPSTASPTTAAASDTSSAPPPTTASSSAVPPTTPQVPAGFYMWNGQEWQPNGSPPECPDLIGYFPRSPVDVSKATAVLAPGQIRGGNYKPHGGFRFDGVGNDDITVVMPIDAELWSAARYLELGEVQYLLTFRTSCGIIFRFDHLRVLSEPLAVAMASIPEPVEGMSATSPLDPPLALKAGDVVATSVGFASNGNVSVDFGVYDPRRQNEASRRPDFPEQQFRELAWYGVCWYPMLPAADAAVVDRLPGGDGQAGRTSDYCPS